MRSARDLLGLTTHETAFRLRISPTTLAKVEHGGRVLPQTEARMIAGLERLGVDIGEDGLARLRSSPR
jgi:transcriptional regulator with XRE-family HTH domain